MTDAEILAAVRSGKSLIVVTPELQALLDEVLAYKVRESALSPVVSKWIEDAIGKVPKCSDK